MAEEDLGNSVLVLFQRPPGAAQKPVAYPVLPGLPQRSQITMCISSLANPR